MYKIKECSICKRKFRVWISTRHGRFISPTEYMRRFNRPTKSTTCSPECQRILYNRSVLKGVLKYQKTEKGKAKLARAMKKYSQTPKGRAANARAVKKYRLKKRTATFL